MKRVLAVLFALYAVVALTAWAGQGYLVYAPDPRRVEPAAVGLADVQERWLETPDGVRVVAWYGKARPGRPTLLYFHGNAANLAARAERIRRFIGQGWGVYMMSYRGYSGSGGVPSEENNHADAKRAYADLLKLGVPHERVVLYGESLGTGVATRIALEVPVRGLILDAPYTSIVDIGQSRYPYLPVDLLLTQRYETIKVIGDLRTPLLVIHGEADRIVPVDMGRTIFAAAKQAAEPRRLVTLPGAGHANHMRFGSFEAIASFLQVLQEG